MNNQVLKHTFSIVKIATNDRNSGEKARPVYVVNINDEMLRCHPVTTKYKDKSEKIKRYYLELLDWKFSNLDKPSWLNIWDRYDLPIDKITMSYVGIMSERDSKRLEAHMKENPSPNYQYFK